MNPEDDLKKLSAEGWYDPRGESAFPLRYLNGDFKPDQSIYGSPKLS